MKTLSTLISSVLALHSASAAITYDFTGKGGTFDGMTMQDVLLSDNVSGQDATMTVTATGGELNSNSGDFGIAGSAAGETSDWIDGTTEAIELTFDSVVELNFIEFGGIGSDSSDGAELTVASTVFSLFTGATNFDGTSDTFTPGSPISIEIGESIFITGTSSTSGFDLENFNVSVVPEPGTFGLLAGFFSLMFVMLKKRNI
jgi:hypothetical protein